MTLELSDITPVSMKARRAGTRYDLRFVAGKKAFQFGNAKARVDPYGFNVGTANGNVYLQCVPDGEGQVYNTKTYTDEAGVKTKREKTGTFQRPALRVLLDNSGLEGINEFKLVEVEIEGAERPIFQIVALGEGESTREVATEEDSEAEVAQEDSAVETEEEGLEGDVELDDEGEDVFASL